MDALDAMEIGKAWSSMGWAQQEQAEAVVNSMADLDMLVDKGALNPNALYDIKDWLRLLAQHEVDEAEGLLRDIESWEHDQELAPALLDEGEES